VVLFELIIHSDGLSMPTDELGHNNYEYAVEYFVPHNNETRYTNLCGHVGLAARVVSCLDMWRVRQWLLAQSCNEHPSEAGGTFV